LPSGKNKLFAGIALDDDARERITEIGRALEARGVRGRWERADKLHITLAFLGWVPSERIDEIQTCMRDCAATHAAFTLRLDKAGAFPNERRPRVVWVGARKQPRAYEELQTNLRDRCRNLGFSFKEEHMVHLTICRIKEPSPLPVIANFPPIDLYVRALTLFESIPEKDTTRHQPLSVVPLDLSR